MDREYRDLSTFFVCGRLARGTIQYRFTELWRAVGKLESDLGLK